MSDFAGASGVTCLIALSAFLISSSVTAGDSTGLVVSILDGDTIEVLHNQHPERIRLNGIDCPEKGQAYGNNAKHAASDLAFGKEVTIQTHGHDKYRRTLGDVILPDGVNLNQELVKDGWCWWYREYALHTMRLTHVQTIWPALSSWAATI